jgi:hypothetical protein
MELTMEIILEDEGIQLIKKGNKYYLKFDEGELMFKIRELEITEEEAKKITENSDIAYDVIISYQEKEKLLKLEAESAIRENLKS